MCTHSCACVHCVACKHSLQLVLACVHFLCCDLACVHTVVHVYIALHVYILCNLFSGRSERRGTVNLEQPHFMVRSLAKCEGLMESRRNTVSVNLSYTNADATDRTQVHSVNFNFLKEPDRTQRKVLRRRTSTRTTLTYKTLPGTTLASKTVARRNRSP